MVNTVFAPARWLSVRQSCQDHLTTEVVQWKLIAAAGIESIPRLLHLHAPNLHLKDETKFRFRKTTYETHRLMVDELGVRMFVQQHSPLNLQQQRP